MKVIIDYDDQGNRIKTEIKIDKQDLWSGGLIMAKVIYQFLKKFKKANRHSLPACFVPELLNRAWQEDLTPEQETETKRLEEESQAQWEESIDKMIYAFYWISMEDTRHDYPESKAYEKKKRAILKPYRKEFARLDTCDFNARTQLEDKIAPELSTEYRQLLENHRIKVEEGLMLFGKHFRSLYD